VVGLKHERRRDSIGETDDAQLSVRPVIRRAGGVLVDGGQKEIRDFMARLMTEADFGRFVECATASKRLGTPFAGLAVFSVASALATIAF